MLTGAYPKKPRRVMAALLFNNFGGGRHPFDSATFYAPLTHSLVLTRGTGNPTFTRATTAYVTDFEGLLKQVPSGAARFSGARVVRNLVVASTNIGGAGFTRTVTGAGSLTQVSSTTYTLATNGTTASDVARIASVSAGTSIPAGSTVTYRVKLSASAPVTLYWVLATSSIDTGANIAVTTTPTVYSRTVSNGTGTTVSVRIQAQGSVSGNVSVDVTMDEWQIEDVTGQSNQFCSDYVSVGVLSAPYHGAGVDGLAYFNYENPWTVTGNVATDNS